MARKQREDERENHERWLVSYADFITLLFAFFVMMFAQAQVQQDRMKEIADSFAHAIEPGHLSHAIARIMGQAQKPDPNSKSSKSKDSKESKEERKTKPDEPAPKVEDLQTQELLPSMQRLTGDLAVEIKDKQLDVRLERRGLVVSLRQATFFPVGDDMIQPATYPMLDRIAAAIKALPNPVRLEGHTDSVPIHTARFRSNWELSAARAIALLELFTERYGIDPNRMAVAGFADTAPAAPNDSDEGRARNRRVDVVILNQAGLKSEPIQGPLPKR